VLETEPLHHGLAGESLLSALLSSTEAAGDLMALPLTDADRRLLAAVLLKEDEELTAERLESAVKALRRIHLRRKLEHVQLELESTLDRSLRVALAEERIRLKRALMDPALAAEETAGPMSGPA